MYVRRTKTSSRKTGEEYSTYRLVESVREGKTVRQRTMLNLGADFDLPQENWADLAARIDDLLHGQQGLLNITQDVEALAQRYAAQILARSREVDKPKMACEAEECFQEVDLATLELVRPRSVGVEHAALSMLRELGIEDKLGELGFSGPQIAAALGNIIGRIAAPASERATHTWLQHSSALGELIGFDYEKLSLQQLYRSADQLLKHRDALESHIFDKASTVFGFEETITLYDLTNTYFEGVYAGSAKAARGRSKEKRSDCPLVTLGLVLDVSGFPRQSRIFEGNVSEAETLETMLETLGATTGSIIVMDAGIATEANLAWLKAQGFSYVTVSRKRERHFDHDCAIEVTTASGLPVSVQRVDSPETGETLLYCHSPMREEKDRAIDARKAKGFEAALERIVQGLTRPRGIRNPTVIHERIGRARERYARAAQHYKVEVILDDDGKAVTELRWSKTAKPNSALTHPGVYCLRTTLSDMDDARLWQIYSSLTNLEAVFRSLKSDLGLRPVFHQKDRRIEAHLAISVLAYNIVHAMRTRLRSHAITDSWDSLRGILSSQIRITTTVKRRDGRTVHVRKASRAEPRQLKIHSALGLSPNPGGTRQTTV